MGYNFQLFSHQVHFAVALLARIVIFHCPFPFIFFKTHIIECRTTFGIGIDEFSVFIGDADNESFLSFSFTYKIFVCRLGNADHCHEHDGKG